MNGDSPASRGPTPFAGGRYLLHREIGRGGTAIVYLARDSLHDTECAIKVLAPKFAAREELRQRFRRECEAMSQIKHPNVLKVITWGIAESSMFLVTEYAAGGSAGAWVRQFGPMSPGRAVRVMLQVCDGVSAAHARGIVHRDIKPDNVLFTSEGEVRVCDFGIAQVKLVDADPLTRTGTSIGTLGFVAPEQLEHPRDVDVRADVYSIGTTLWFLMRGAVPPYAFRADPYQEGIVGPIVPIVARATAFKREGRHEDIAALRAELAEVLPRLPPESEVTPLGAPTDPAVSGAASGEPFRVEPESTWVDNEGSD